MSETENKVTEILKEYLSWEEKKENIKYETLSITAKNRLRIKYDKDASYYKTQTNPDTGVIFADEEVLFADTIASFWTPYKTLLKLEAEWDVYKTAGSLGALLRQINASWNNEYTSKIKEVNKQIEKFADACYTKGNYMLLPKRAMNIQRYRVAEDRIDRTLYESFDKGLLSGFFENNEKLLEWVDKEKLAVLFKDGVKSKDNICWLVEKNNFQMISEMRANEVYDYLENVTTFIIERTRLIDNLVMM